MSYDFNQAGYVFVGTAKEIEDRGVKLNGKFLDRVTISALSRHNLIEIFGKAEKETKTRGRTPCIFGLKNQEGMKFTFSE